MFDIVCLTDEFFTRYISALFECGFPTKLLLLALLRLAGGLTSTIVEVQCLAVWCCLVSILSVRVFGLISVLTDMGDED